MHYPLKMLIVDDDSICLDALSTHLKSVNIQYDIARNGLEAYKIIEND
jgi:PleD family two-component response regulator